MISIELFAGSCTFSDIAKSYGYETFTTDSGLDLFTVDHYSKLDLVSNIFDIELYEFPRNPEIIWASPPCTTFSIASCGHHWYAPDQDGIRKPKTTKAEEGLLIVEKTLYILNQLQPRYFFIENPRGLLRKMDCMQPLEKYRKTVTYCTYGDNRMKPTDIWTNLNWKPRSMCKNGDSCHESAPRGSATGTQGLANKYERSKLPKELCKEILETIKKIKEGEE